MRVMELLCKMSTRISCKPVLWFSFITITTAAQIEHFLWQGWGFCRFYPLRNLNLAFKVPLLTFTIFSGLLEMFLTIWFVEGSVKSYAEIGFQQVFSVLGASLNIARSLGVVHTEWGVLHVPHYSEMSIYQIILCVYFLEGMCVIHVKAMRDSTRIFWNLPSAFTIL